MKISLRKMYTPTTRSLTHTPEFDTPSKDCYPTTLTSNLHAQQPFFMPKLPWRGTDAPCTRTGTHKSVTLRQQPTFVTSQNREFCRRLNSSEGAAHGSSP